jgi:hypothetical protein
MVIADNRISFFVLQYGFDYQVLETKNFETGKLPLI